MTTSSNESAAIAAARVGDVRHIRTTSAATIEVDDDGTISVRTGAALLTWPQEDDELERCSMCEGPSEGPHEAFCPALRVPLEAA